MRTEDKAESVIVLELCEVSPWVVEIFLVNPTSAATVYPMGFGMRSSRYSSIFEVRDTSGTVWFAVGPSIWPAEIDRIYCHSDPIPVAAGGRIRVGGADLFDYEYGSERFSKFGHKQNRQAAELTKSGAVQARWHNGEGIIRPPGYSNWIKLSRRLPTV